jgi:hypothetical protein
MLAYQTCYFLLSESKAQQCCTLQATSVKDRTSIMPVINYFNRPPYFDYMLSVIKNNLKAVKTLYTTAHATTLLRTQRNIQWSSHFGGHFMSVGFVYHQCGFCRRVNRQPRINLLYKYLL